VTIAALVACGGGAGNAPGDTGSLDATADSPAPASTRDGSTDAGDDAVGFDAPAPASDAAHDAPGEAGDGGAPQAVALPMYVDPSSAPALWSAAYAAAPTVALLVANPDSGPGTAVDAQYTQAIARAHAAGQTVVGYVHTSYGARPIAQVEADIDSWYALYPAVDGIFSDETSTDTTTVAPYYEPLFEYVKGKSGARTVVINPGTMIDESFMSTADVVVTFEDTYTHYTDGTYPATPAWVEGYSRWRFWHLVLSAATAAEMQSAVTLARQRNAGYVYVTDQPPATAYQQLVTGTYWQAELAAVTSP
jgi:hypothetical protein